MNIIKTLTEGLGKLAYDSADEGGKQNFGEWDEAPDVVRSVHDEMAKAVCEEVVRRLYSETMLYQIKYADMSSDCMAMIHECFEGMGMDIKGTAPMFYPEAMQTLLFDRLKEAGAFPGHAATVRYEPSVDKPGAFNRIEAT